jgi:hypothetical protein
VVDTSEKRLDKEPKSENAEAEDKPERNMNSAKERLYKGPRTRTRKRGGGFRGEIR